MPQQPQPNSQPASQASQRRRRRRHHGCTVVAVTTAIIRTRHTRALRQTLYRRGCGHLAPLTNRPPPRPTPSLPSRSPTGFDRRYNFKLPTVGGLWLRSDRELRNPWRNFTRVFARVRRMGSLPKYISPSSLALVEWSSSRRILLLLLLLLFARMIVELA